MKKNQKKIKADEFDKAFEEGSIVEHLDMKTAKMNYPVHWLNSANKNLCRSKKRLL